jgi:hypothetical protein
VKVYYSEAEGAVMSRGSCPDARRYWWLWETRCLGPLVAALLAGCQGHNKEASVDQPLDLIPARFRGDWRLVGADGEPLPIPYPDFELIVAERPADCLLYRDKGVSRLRVFEGARAFSRPGAAERQRLVLRFTAADARTFELALERADSGQITGAAIHHIDGQTDLDAKIALQ